MNYPIDISTVELTTEHLRLRPWHPDDLNDFFEYARVEGVGEMAGWPHHTDIEGTRTILNQFIEGKITFALEYRGKVIGSLGIERYDEEALPELQEQKAREIGFVLSKDYWGRGLMPEAVRAVLQYLFETAGLDAVVCGYYIGNGQSARVQEKCGFRHLRTMERLSRYGESHQCAMNVLTKEEFRAQQ